MRRVVLRVLLSVGLIALLSGVWAGVGAGPVPFDDERNGSDAYYDALNGGKCAAHHEDQGFDPMRIGLVERYSEIPVGEDVTLVMRVRQASGIGQTVQNIALHVNVSRAPGVVVLSDDFIEDLAWTNETTLESGGATQVRFPVHPGARHIRVEARATGQETLEPYGLADGALTMEMSTDAGRGFDSDGDRSRRIIERDGDAARDLGTGTFTVDVAWSSSFDSEMPVVIETTVTYPRQAEESTFYPPEGTLLRKGDHVDIPFPIRFTEPGQATIDFRVESVSFWPHLATSNAPRDDGLFYRFATLEVLGGDRVVKTESSFAPVPVGPGVDLYNLFARIVGFVTLILVPMALVTGGVFGRGSRRWLNRWTGGPKRRVMWHMAMSWFIIVLASMHFVLALLESQFLWTKGIFWGGVAWALLATLGFSGYYQARIIKRWGYRAWRHVHLWPAVGVLAFGLFHALLDGSDLTALRDLLPGADRLVWP